MAEAVDNGQGVGSAEAGRGGTDVRITILRTVIDDPRAARILSKATQHPFLDIPDERREALLGQIDNAVGARPGRAYDDMMRDSIVVSDFPEFSRADDLVRETGIVASRVLEIHGYVENDFAKRQREENGQPTPAEEVKMFTPDSILEAEIFSPAVADVIKVNRITDSTEVAAYEQAGKDLANLYVDYHNRGYAQRELWNIEATIAIPRGTRFG